MCTAIAVVIIKNRFFETLSCYFNMNFIKSNNNYEDFIVSRGYKLYYSIL